MIIDHNAKEKEAFAAYSSGDKLRGDALQDEFVAQLRESLATQDHCSCTKECKYHGICIECVAIHRAHRDHLPNCFHDMVNERIEVLSALSEHSVAKQIT